MFSIYQLKPKFRELLSPVCSFLRNKDITPNQITLFTVFWCLLGGLSLVFCKIGLLLIPLFIFVRMALNAIDGLMATTYKLCSEKGELFNELGDLLGDIFLYTPFVIFFQDDFLSVMIISIFIILSVLTEFSGLLSKVLNNIRTYDGPMGKSDRAFVIGLYSLFLFFSFDFAKIYSIYFYGILCILCLITCFNRLKSILRK